jgi:hypothetical protein
MSSEHPRYQPLQNSPIPTCLRCFLLNFLFSEILLRTGEIPNDSGPDFNPYSICIWRSSVHYDEFIVSLRDVLIPELTFVQIYAGIVTGPTIFIYMECYDFSWRVITHVEQEGRGRENVELRFGRRLEESTLDLPLLLGWNEIIAMLREQAGRLFDQHGEFRVERSNFEAIERHDSTTIDRLQLCQD